MESSFGNFKPSSSHRKPQATFASPNSCPCWGFSVKITIHVSFPLVSPALNAQVNEFFFSIFTCNLLFNFIVYCQYLPELYRCQRKINPTKKSIASVAVQTVSVVDHKTSVMKGLINNICLTNCSCLFATRWLNLTLYTHYNRIGNYKLTVVYYVGNETSFWTSLN